MAGTSDDSFEVRLHQAFADQQRPAVAELFGGSILHTPGQERPDLWPEDWRQLDCAAVMALDWNSLSSDGFRFYLPALLLAGWSDIGCGIRAQLLLTDGLLDSYRALDVRFGGAGGSWLQMRSRYLSRLTPEQAGLVVEFLMRCRDGAFMQDEQRRRIEEALANFWLDHAGLRQEAFWQSHGRLPQRPAQARHRPLPRTPTLADLKAEIATAFTALHPGDDAIRGSDLGCEPFEVAALYRGRDDWRTLEPAFLDQAGLGFLSAEAFRFYLPAFLLADLDDALMSATPSFYLSHGLDDVGKLNRVNPHMYGERTWFDHIADRFAVFTTAEAHAVLGYLLWVVHRDHGVDTTIAEAIDNYWLARTGM